MDQQQEIKAGMRVRADSGESLGEVEKVAVRPEEGVTHLLVSRGPTVVPVQSVARVENNEVHLAVDVSGFDNRDWDAAPAQAPSEERRSNEEESDESFVVARSAASPPMQPVPRQEVREMSSSNPNAQDSLDAPTPVGESESAAQSADAVRGETSRSGGEVLSSDTTTIQRHEEQLSAEKNWVESGTLKVRKRVVEEARTLSVDLAREVYDVERTAVNRAWQPGDDAPRQEGDTLVVSVIEEVVELIRRKVVVEEVRLTKRVVTENVQQEHTIRKEVVEIEGPTAGNDAAPAS
ncbi:MAG: YsnF/AvaK domain-containing protein [Chloroflexia bacterium]